MLIDQLTLHLKAGRGGDGVVRWRHEKGRDHGGPSGGNGGKGGDVYAVAVRDIGILAAYRDVKVIEAANGEDGAKDLKQGKAGNDVEVKLPIGARITNLETKYSVELLNDGERVQLLKGGRGGLGNEHFKSSVNIRPQESTEGEDGEESDFDIALSIIADVGLIGLPNAGKSSLLNTLTKAHSKVGDFPFTTLEPHLGSYYGLILADIPGLIEGASNGRGLGHKFLKHVERTKFLLHCVSAESLDVKNDYSVVRKELGLYNNDMLKKGELVVLTKVDMVSKDELEKKIQILKELNPNVVPLSILDDRLVTNLGDQISQKVKNERL